MRRRKYLGLALALGVFTALLALSASFPGDDPSIWAILSEATGLRPAASATPLLWRRLVSLGVAPTLVGGVGLGVFAASFFVLLWRLLALRICPSENYRNWWRFTLPSVAAVGTLLAVFSEPVWRLALTGGPALLTLALMLLAADLFFSPFFSDVRTGACPYLGFALAGFLAVETPVALALPVLFAVGADFLMRRVEDGRYRDYPQDLPVFLPVRFSSWLAFFAWCGGAALAGGLVAASGVGLPAYVLDLMRDVRLSASLVGWVLWPFFALVPVALAFGLSSVLVSRVGRLEFSFGVLALVAGCVACAPVVPVDGLHYWRFLSVPTVSSPLMLALGATLSALAVGLSLAVFAYFAYHAMPTDYAPRKPVAFLVSAAFAVLAGVALTGSVCPEARELRQVISDAVDETVREAEGVRWLYTDGSCDAGLALAARRRGLSFETLPLSGPDAKAAQLRDWVTGDSTNLAETAVQLGFELWARERKTPPAASGFLARTGAFPDAERGRTAAAALGERMTELAQSGVVVREDDSAVRAAFSSLLWRLSRLARLAGDGTRADALDAANGTLRHMLERMRHERTAAFLQLTDAEGLELALKRADFVEARRFAAGVLKRNADDVGANFGMGMSYLLEGKLDDAALYLERARRQKPAEPAILNNLAIVCLRKGELEKAEDLAKRALERAPQIAEIQDTVKRIREAKRK